MFLYKVTKNPNGIVFEKKPLSAQGKPPWVPITKKLHSFDAAKRKTMKRCKPNKKPNKMAQEVIRDDGENIGRFEPLMMSDGSKFRPQLNDMALNLAERSAPFISSLPSATAHALPDLVHSMNCYYSNSIEGHNTHPIDIEHAFCQRSQCEYSKA